MEPLNEGFPISYIRGMGLSIPMPDGWENRSQLILVSNTGESFRPNIVVVKEPLRGRTIPSFIAEHTFTLESTFEAFEVKSAGPLTLGPHQGHYVEYTFEAQGEQYQQGQFFLVVRDEIFTITYSDRADKFHSTRLTARRVISEIAIVDGELANGADLASRE